VNSPFYETLEKTDSVVNLGTESTLVCSAMLKMVHLSSKKPKTEKERGKQMLIYEKSPILMKIKNYAEKQDSKIT